MCSKYICIIAYMNNGGRTTGSAQVFPLLLITLMHARRSLFDFLLVPRPPSHSLLFPAEEQSFFFFFPPGYFASLDNTPDAVRQIIARSLLRRAL